MLLPKTLQFKKDFSLVEFKKQHRDIAFYEYLKKIINIFRDILNYNDIKTKSN